MKDLKILSLLGSILLLVAIVAMSSRCTLNQSKLVNDNNVSIECRITLELAYYSQKQIDKSVLVDAIRACKESNRFTRCQQYIDNRTLFSECKELLK